MRKFKVALLLSLAALLLCISATAVIIPERVTAATTKEGYNYMMRLIGKQSFSDTLPKEKVKEYIEHYTYDSDFAAYYRKEFPSKNNIGYYNSNRQWIPIETYPTYTSLSDGTYSHTGKGAQGCCLYSRHITLVIYGCEGGRVYLKQNSGETRGDALKRLLLTYGQAGEHLRINNKHSITYISGDDNGFYYFNYEYNDWNVITMNYESYEAVADRYKDYSMWLYDSNTLVNDLNAQPDPEYFIPDDIFIGTPEYVCPHEKYSAVGFCKVCGEEFPYKFDSISQIKFEVNKAVIARLRPYAVAGGAGKFKVGDTVTVLGKTNNHHGNLWYLVTCERLGGGSYWIFCNNVSEINEVSITLNDVVYTGESSVKVSAVCSYTLQRPSRVALLVGSTKKGTKRVAFDEIDHNKNPFDIWYNLTDVEKDKLYYYRIIAEYDRLDYPTSSGSMIVASDYGTFMIASPKVPDEPEVTEPVTKPDTTVVDNVTQGLLDAIIPVKFEVKAVTNLTTTSARFNASCTYIGTRPTYVCLYLGLSADENSMWQVGYDSINFKKNPFDVWYDISGMAENTIYYYQFRAEADGKIYKSEIRNVSTMDRTPVDNVMDTMIGALGALGNTKTGVVTGTNSLAINNKPAASPKYSTMLGAVPGGASVTVYPDKQSGNWYYITYNGVSGYAYGKYINLK